MDIDGPSLKPMARARGCCHRLDADVVSIFVNIEINSILGDPACFQDLRVIVVVQRRTVIGRYGVCKAKFGANKWGMSIKDEYVRRSRVL
jgi:hypothetical protein